MMHRHFSTYAPVIALLIISATVHAGTQARIEGRVTDLEGNPIKGAIVTITSEAVAGFEKVIEVNAKGEFKTLILDATRNYMFTVEAEGYQGEERNFKVPVGSTDNVFEFTLMTVEQALAKGSQQIYEQPGYKQLEEAKALMKAGDKDGARVKFAEAVAAKPDLLPAIAGLAELTYESGDMERALALARDCLEQDDESVQCLAIAVNASGALGDEAARAEFMAKYQAVNPDDPTVLFNEAAVYLNNLDDENARPLLEKCLEADPEFPECNFEYGMLLLRTGDLEGAKTHLEKYLEVAPNGADASTAEETIKYL